MVNNDPTGEAWFFKMSLKNQRELDGLMSEDEYKKHIE